MQNEALEDAIVAERNSWWVIWLLPILAALVGAWLAYQQFVVGDIHVKIHFSTGDGLIADQTEVRHQGIPLGRVTDFYLKPDGEGVIVEVQMDRRSESVLRDETDFWLVKPEFSLSGVSGLDTLVSGNYIALNPGDGHFATEFTALDKPPKELDLRDGLRITLLADELGGINRGAPVHYRQLSVGEVEDYRLNEQADGIEFVVRINPEYQHLLHSQSRFWLASGISVKGGLGGVDVDITSLAALVAGGVTFATPEAVTVPTEAQEHARFTLYPSFDEAAVYETAELIFDSAEGLKAGSTEVRQQGFVVGKVLSLTTLETVTAEMDDQADLSATSNKPVAREKVQATLAIDPQYAHQLRDGSRFWPVTASVGPDGVKGLETVIGGAYIEWLPGDGDLNNSFTALAQAPAINPLTPGVRFRLQSDKLGSVSVGSEIYYRQIPVGQVESFQLTKDQRGVVFDIFIEQQYSHLVRRDSHFWNVSGVSVSGGLGGVEVRTESLMSILKGGIAFDRPNRSSAAQVNQLFTLYDDKEAARETGVAITLQFANGDGLTEGTEIKYQGQVIGEIKTVTLRADLDGVDAEALLTQRGEAFARADSRFWAVRPKLGLAATENLDTLITGPYIGVLPGKGKPAHQFTALEHSPALTSLSNGGLNLVLETDRLGSLKEGVGVYYREVPVGKVVGYQLSPQSNQVWVFINVEAAYAPLVRDSSRFWNASGIGIDVSLFGGAKIRTESFESLIQGGIAFATPNHGNSETRALNGDRYYLHEQVLDEWKAWNPVIPLPGVAALAP